MIRRSAGAVGTLILFLVFALVVTSFQDEAVTATEFRPTG